MLIKLRPDWAEGEVERTFQSVEEGTSWKTRFTVLEVVITGSAEDGPEWRKHIGSKEARRKLASFQMAQLCYDVTVRFCDWCIRIRSSRKARWRSLR